MKKTKRDRHRDGRESWIKLKYLKYHQLPNQSKQKKRDLEKSKIIKWIEKVVGPSKSVSLGALCPPLQFVLTVGISVKM